MDSLEQALYKHANKINNEVLKYPPTPKFDEEKLIKRIDYLDRALNEAEKYGLKADRDSMDFHIEKLETKIAHAEKDTEISVLQKELDDFLLRKDGYDFRQPFLQERKELEIQLSNFREEIQKGNKIIAN